MRNTLIAITVGLLAILGLCILGTRETITARPAPAATTPRPTQAAVAPQPAPSSGRELNLFWHYERDLRAMVTWDQVDIRARRLILDVGRTVVKDVATAVSNGKYDTAVDLLATALYLTPAERRAWRVMLPVLVEDESRPSWQRAGVRR